MIALSSPILHLHHSPVTHHPSPPATGSHSPVLQHTPPAHTRPHHLRSTAAPHSRIPMQRLPGTHATPAQQPAYAYAYAKGRTESSRFSTTHYATCHKQRQSPHASRQSTMGVAGAWRLPFSASNLPPEAHSCGGKRSVRALIAASRSGSFAEGVWGDGEALLSSSLLVSAGVFIRPRAALPCRSVTGKLTCRPHGEASHGRSQLLS